MLIYLILEWFTIKWYSKLGCLWCFLFWSW